MKQILCVYLKNWPIDRLKRKLRALSHKPLVLIETIANRQIVVALSDEAREKSIRPGMPLIEAQALCPGVVHTDHNPDRDLQSLHSLGRFMQRFTPIVALPDGLTPSLSPSPGTPGEGRGEGLCSISNLKSQISILNHLFLDLTGCERLFNGMQNLLHQISAALTAMNLSFNLALAPNPGAAWALAAYGKQLPIENCQLKIDNLVLSLAALPPAALRIDTDTAASLYHLGIETIGQLLALPRHDLPSRFGPDLLTRLDQALGKIEEPLVALPHPSPIEVSLQFESAIDSLEMIWFAFKELLRRAVDELKRRGCGARKLKIQFIRAYAPPLEKTIDLSRPSRNPVNLFNLLRCVLETLETDEGFIGLQLAIPVFEKLSEEQALILAQDDLTNRAELDHLIERLCARLGHDALLQPKLTESYIPELAYACHAINDRRASSTVSMKKKSYIDPSPYTLDPGPSRPLYLLPDPSEIRVMVAPSDDRDGRPVQFSHSRQVHTLAHALGPERIAGEWWRGHNKTRDYYEVENHQGRRFWIFRVRETNRWFLHGMRE